PAVARFGVGPRRFGHLLTMPGEGLGGLARAAWGWSQQLPLLKRTVVWDVPSGEVLLDVPEAVHAGAQFSPDGRYLVPPLGTSLDPENPQRYTWWVYDLAQPARRIALETPPEWRQAHQWVSAR